MALSITITFFTTWVIAIVLMMINNELDLTKQVKEIVQLLTYFMSGAAVTSFIFFACQFFFKL